MLILFIGIVLLLTESTGALIVYFTGAVPIAGIRIYNRLVCIPERRRINTILSYSSLFLLAAGAAYYFGKPYWVVFILITAVIDFYVSFRKIK